MNSILEEFRHLDADHVKKGDAILEEGSQSQVLYVLAHGSVDVYKGETRVASSSEPGAVFGEISVLLDAPHTATVRAAEDSTFYKVENPEHFLQAHPVVALHVSRLLAKRLDTLTRYLIDVKQQFEGDDHIGMVDDILDSLINRQPKML
jgi:CRP/FNR family cyclic AMP-dependent transcriptional regulator